MLPAETPQSRGGKSRAAKLSAERRVEIASGAAQARWGRRPLKPANAADVLRVEAALVALQAALRLLVAGGSDKTAVRVRSAIKSCDGALRHVRRRAGATLPG